MKCPKCQFENPDTQKFCGQCGAKLEKTCPNCGEGNPPEYRFCGECGHNLTLPIEPTPKDLSFDEKLDKIQRYLPKGLTEKILSQRDKIEGERKQVTVMFCDMEGFTNLSERLGPEEAYSIMDQVYEILIHRVHDYEGTVNEMTGDGIMALFGAPIALEDAPQRAIRSAYSIHREMVRFSDKIRQQSAGIPPIKMRIGIHTGPVVVGTLGNDLRVEFKAVGDTVNLASRMEGLAEPGATYVTEDTFKLTEGFFRFEALGEKEVKGKKEAVKVYRVIAPSTRRTRFDVSADRGLTPFVGKERELELLLDGLERSKAGRGQAFSIMGEAGVGKSRLLYEFRKAVASEDVTFLEGRCLSYSRDIAYHLHIDVLKANFDIRERDGDSEIREKVKRGLKILKADEASTLPYLLELLSVKDSGIDKIPMSPEVRRERMIEALRHIVLKGSEVRPLILAHEDLHWVDKSSEEYLKNLLDSIPGARVFLIFTYRPEFVHTWGGKSYHSQVTLNRLSNRESLAMVSHLLGTDQIESGLEEFILEKTEGIPFFIEEFIKSLRDLGIIERKDNTYRIAKDIQTVTIPATIQDVIMARVDSLPEIAKGLLQTGSVLGREFSHDLINRVVELPEQELISHLSALKDSELLYERGIYPQSTYIFKHALTQEVAYDSLLLKRRKEIHEEIGKAIEQLYPDRLEELYEMLGYHYSKSENHEKAYHYLVQAGDAAARLYAYAEARLHYARALEALARLPDTEDNHRRRVDTLIKQVSSSWRADPLEQNLTHLFEAERLAKELPGPDGTPDGDRLRLARIHYWIGRIHYGANKMPEAIGYFQRVLEVAEELDDPELLAIPSLTIGAVMVVQGHLGKGMALLSKAIPASAQMGKWPEWARAVGHRSYALSMSGDCALGVAEAQRAVARAEEISSLGEIAMSNAFLSAAYLYAGDMPHAIEAGRKTVEAGEQSKERMFVCLGNAWRAWAEGRAGDFEAAADSMARSQAILEELGGQIIAADWIATINAEIALGMGRIEEAIALAERAIGIAQKMGGIFAEGLARQVQGQALAAVDPPRWDEAENQLTEGLRLLESGQHRVEAARTHVAWGSVCRARGDLAAARGHWEQAAAQWEASDLTHELERTRALIVDLASQ
jgi:class 3 adenylate cyclase/tetratricopeptide (TPR) repeat protein